MQAPQRPIGPRQGGVWCQVDLGEGARVASTRRSAGRKYTAKQQSFGSRLWFSRGGTRHGSGLCDEHVQFNTGKQTE